MKSPWIYAVIGLVVLLLIYFAFFRKKAAANTDTPAATTFGVTQSGKAITESMITEEMKSIESYNKAFIQEKATTNGKTYREQLRLDAIWMLQNANGH